MKNSKNITHEQLRNTLVKLQNDKTNKKGTNTMLNKNELGYLGEANEELYGLLSSGEIRIKETDYGILITSKYMTDDGVWNSRVMIEMRMINNSVFGWVSSHDDDARFWYGSRSLHPMTWAFIKRVLELQ